MKNNPRNNTSSAAPIQVRKTEIMNPPILIQPQVIGIVKFDNFGGSKLLGEVLVLTFCG